MFQFFRGLSLIAVALVFFATGCNTVNRMQAEISPAPPDPLTGETHTLTDADRQVVLDIAKTAAERLNLEDITPRSMLPGTLVFYQGKDVDYPIKLVVWQKDGKILVDMSHDRGALGESNAFRDNREQVVNSLRERLGYNRVRLVPIRDL